MISHLGKPQIRELEIITGGFLRTMICYNKNSKVEYITISENNSLIFKDRIRAFQKSAEKENFKLTGVYTHNNKESYLFSKKIK